MNREEHESGAIVLRDIPFEITASQVLESLKMRNRNSSLEKMAEELAGAANRLASPRALYKVSYIEKRSEDSLVIEGIEFKSRILRMNTESAERVFPYVVTAGGELDSMAVSKDDYMRVFCLDAVKELVLEAAIGFFESYVGDAYGLGATAHMNPGSLVDWPISEQPKLFRIFGNVSDLVGVGLTESCLMNPIKSVSGVYFPTEVNFRSCMLCPRHSCSKRRAEFNPEMVARYT